MNWLPAAAAAMVGLAAPVGAQTTLDRPVGEPRPFALDSGRQANSALAPEIAFADVVWIEEAAWIRLFFDQADLEGDSFVRVTSLYDGDVQELDASQMKMWSNSTAYFNGPAVLLELVTDPGTTRNRIVIDEVVMEASSPLPAGGCGICGPDDRVQSFEEWAARLLPAGCSASVFNTDSCMVSAGHCVSGGMIVQFNVPNSDPNCTLNHPPANDQFPITTWNSQNLGVGLDWSVLITGTNGLGERPYDRYGVLRPIATAAPANEDPVAVWGYGIDDQCTLNQVQQTASGEIVELGANYFRHVVDITFGNSGSSVIRNGEIVGIITHCPCPGWATRWDQAAFTAAREALCPGGALPGDVDGDGDVDITDFLLLLSDWGPCPEPCPPSCAADFDDDCNVGITDFLILLANWS